MTDFLLAVGSFAGLLAYATVAVAVYRWWCARRGPRSTWEPEWWQRAGLSVTWLALYTVVLLVALGVTHPSGNDAPAFVALWGAVGGAAALVAAILSLLGGTAPEAFHVFRSIVWPVAVPLGWLIHGAMNLTAFCSRGPLAWGGSLATLVDPKAKREVEARERAEREARITAKERELGLREEIR